MTHHLKSLVPGFVVAVALAFGTDAATPPTTPAAKPAAQKSADMKAECQAMTAKYQEMHAHQAAMDVTLDKLVANMNTAKVSADSAALTRSMAAVLNELIVQRKASRTMMADMQPSMMAHQMHHGGLHGTAGDMECPMMKAMAPTAKVSELNPKP